jgi:Zn-dependent peptidase ImmA (M78 family)
MSFIHPGRLFIEKYGQVSSLEDILAYAEFLRKEANVDGQLPVDLQAIVQHFGIKPKSVPLPVQGMLVDAEQGLILINANDIEHRQKFSLAHELIEYLFTELPQDKHWAGNWFLEQPGGFRKGTKEFYCNWAGANLLMPPTYVMELIEHYGVSFECAKVLAQNCNVSLSAALIQLAKMSPRGHIVVLWRMKNKPTEIKSAASEHQLSMFSIPNSLPPKKLRVEWAYGSEKSKKSPYIPKKDKSAENYSLIHSAWETGKFTSGKEKMTLDNKTSHWYYSENMPYPGKDERYVLSLIESVSE